MEASQYHVSLVGTKKENKVISHLRVNQMRTSKARKKHAAVGKASHQHGLLAPTPNKALISPVTVQRTT
jgi:hypothetical protein